MRLQKIPVGMGVLALSLFFFAGCGKTDTTQQIKQAEKEPGASSGDLQGAEEEASPAEEEQSIGKAYREELEKLRKTVEESFYGEYILYDIEKDGIPECIAINETDAYSGEHTTYIYSWNEGKVNTVTVQAPVCSIKGNYMYSICGAATGSRENYWQYTGKTEDPLMTVLSYTNPETGEDETDYEPDNTLNESYTDEDFLAWKDSLDISDIEQPQYALSMTEITDESIKQLKVESGK